MPVSMTMPWAPSLLRYRVEGLLVPPDAQAFTDRGVAVPLLPDPDEARAFTARGGISPGEEPEMLALAEKTAKAYSEFLSKDAAKRDILALSTKAPISMTPLRASTTTGTAPIPPIASKISGCTISEAILQTISRSRPASTMWYSTTGPGNTPPTIP